MTARRRLLAAASATLTLAALTACERPAPIVTVVSGGESTYTEATTFCFEEDQTLEGGDCAERASEVTELSVRPGETVGVDVDKELVDRGWTLQIVDPQNPEQPQQSELQDGHYFSFTAPGLQTGARLEMVVRTVEGEAATGEWRFALVPRR